MENLTGKMGIKIPDNNCVAIFLFYIATLIISFIAALILAPLWQNSVFKIHALLEVICIIISMATFLVIWNTCERNRKFDVMGLGFLAVAIFDALHTCFYPGMDQIFGGYYGLTTKYWILGRFTEAITLLFCTHKVYKLYLNKWRDITLLLLIIATISSIVYYYPDSLPDMITDKGPTPIKILFEYIIIAIFICNLLLMRKHIYGKDNITYRYVFLAILTAIAAEICFTLYDKVTSFYTVYGHMLKISYYIFLYRGIFQGLITYPYDELNQARYQVTTVLDSLPMGVVMYNDKSELTYVNERCQEFLNTKAEELLGKNVDQISLRFCIPKDVSIAQQMFIHNKQSINEIKTYNVDGNPVKLSVRAIKLNNGIICLLNDPAKEQELENLQLQSQTILNSINNLVIMINNKGEIILCNKAAKEFLGVSEDILGLNICALADISKHNNNELYEEIMKGNGIDKEINYISPSGIKKTAVIHSSPIYNIENDVLGFISIGSDITEAKIQQEKAIQQEKLALVGQLGASIVHETKNYLSVIKGSSQILKIYAKEDKIKQYVEKINKATDEVNKIISDLLTLGKPKKLELEKTSLNEIVITMKGILEASSLMQGVDINISLSEENTLVMCDKGQMIQVILNITKNAVEAMENVENPILLISTGLDNASRESFIKVVDNGKGMPDDILKKVGTPFFTTKEKGTGLGLTVCLQIVKEFGGRLEIKSSEGKGTAFKVILPVVEDNCTYAESDMKTKCIKMIC